MSEVTLEDTRSIVQLLGCLIVKPDLLSDSKYNLSNDDFPEKFHKIIFAAINNLYQEGVVKIDTPTIDSFLTPYDVQHKIFEDNHGIDVLMNTSGKANLDNFDYLYERTKKFSFLRSCQQKGIKIDDIYPINNMNLREDEEMKKRFDQCSLEDLMQIVDEKIVALKQEFKSDKSSYDIQAAENADKVVEEFENTPDFGAPLCSKYLNTICRGARRGKFYIRSLPTGGGKTRLAVADLLNICCDEIYNSKKKRWESHGVSAPGLFITTELEPDEIQTLMIAFLTNIEEHKILENTTTNDEKERIKHAIELIKRTPLWIKYQPDFDIEDIKRIVEQYIVRHGVEYVVFDYMHTSLKLMSEISTKSRISGLREDQMLLQLSMALKNIATQQNVWILSATQVNANIKEKGQQDESSLRGARSIADKADVGMIMRPTTKADYKLIEDILHNNHFMGVDKPNYICSIYKNRRGRYTHCDVYLKVNLGTNRTKDCFVTKNDELVKDIKLTDLVKTEFDF